MRIAITLHDNSLVQVTKTDAGMLYLEVYGSEHAIDGHGMILRGSTILNDAARHALLAMLAPVQEGE